MLATLVDSAVTKPVSDLPERSEALTLSKTAEILWDSAWEALVLAFLVQIFGSVAIGLASGVWRQMTPSLPPVLFGKPRLEAEPPSSFDFAPFRRHRFAILFGVLFVAKVAARLIHYSRNTEHRNAAAWVQRVSRRLSTQWFSLVVGNAFTAFVGVLVLQIVQRFSLSQILLQMLFEALHPAIRFVAGLLPGQGASALIEGLFTWFGANQFKFTFWLLYSAAICDDLGIPNYKTLARWLWQRLKRPRKLAPAQPVALGSPSED